MKRNNMSILVVSCDDYSDLWDPFFFLMNKYWKDNKYPIYLTTNTKNYIKESINVINNPKDFEWSKRTKSALEKINSEYVLLLLEDYFFSKKVDNQKIMDILQLMTQDKILYYKLNSFSKINSKAYNNKNYLKIIPNDLKYGVSLQPAIWNTKFLYDLIGDGNYNPWYFEKKILNENLKIEPKKFLYDNRHILNIKHGLVKGKWLPSTLKYFKRRGINLNKNNDRKKLSIEEVLILNIKKYIKFFLRG